MEQHNPGLGAGSVHDTSDSVYLPGPFGQILVARPVFAKDAPALIRLEKVSRSPGLRAQDFIRPAGVARMPPGRDLRRG